MEFTGERIIPGGVNDDLLNEHLCRYWFARLLVEDKVVLDVGSGVGYGSKILAEQASSVFAVDVSEEAVRYAGERYAGENIELVVGDCHKLPLASDSVDVVVSFELIEHLQGQQTHLLEVSRVLKPDGLTVISTPNRIFYSQESNQVNPFHTHEFDFQEFLEFLKSVFSSVQIYFQNHVAGLIIGNPGLCKEVTTCLQEASGDLEATSNFLVAVCTHGHNHQPRLGNFCLLPGGGNLLRERQLDIRRLEEEVAKLDRALTRLQSEYEERTGWALQLNRQVKSRDQSLIRLRNEFEDRSRRTEELSRRLEARERAIGKLQAEFEDRSCWAAELSRRLQARDKALGGLQAEFEDRSRRAEELSRQVEARDKALGELQAEFKERSLWADQLSRKVEARDKALGELQAEFKERSLWADQLSRKVEARDKALGELQAEFENRSRWAEELSRRLEASDRALGKLQAEFKERSRWAEQLSRRLQARDRALGRLRSEFEERSHWAENLSRQVEARDRALGELQSEFEERSRWAEELSRQLQAIEEAQSKLQSEFEDRTEWALRLDAELQRSDAELQLARWKLEAVSNSRLFKLARLLGWKLKV